MTANRQIRFWLIGLALFLGLLFVLGDVLLPFVVGMAIAYLLDPLCDRLETWRWPRWLATTVVLLGFFLLVLAVILLLVPVAWWSFTLATGVSDWCFLDLVNLAFHEAGHLIMSVAGVTLHYLGGTLVQLAVPRDEALGVAHLEKLDPARSGQRRKD